MAARRLKATWTIEPADDLMREFVGRALGIDYTYIRPVRWWQVWRWHRAWSEDYILSRAGELVLIRKNRSTRS